MSTNELPTIEIDPEEYARGIIEGYKAIDLPDDPGATTEELAKEWGLSESTTRRRVAKMTKAGLIIEGKRTVTDERGRQYRTPVYRIKKQEEEGKDAQ